MISCSNITKYSPNRIPNQYPYMRIMKQTEMLQVTKYWTHTPVTDNILNVNILFLKYSLRDDLNVKDSKIKSKVKSRSCHFDTGLHSLTNVLTKTSRANYLQDIINPDMNFKVKVTISRSNQSHTIMLPTGIP